jgi:hypothetical protein
MAPPRCRDGSGARRTPALVWTALILRPPVPPRRLGGQQPHPPAGPRGDKYHANHLETSETFRFPRIRREPQAKHCVLDHIPTSRTRCAASLRSRRPPRQCRRFGFDFAQCSAVAWRRRAAAVNGASGVLCCVLSSRLPPASSRLPPAVIDRRRGAADLGCDRRDRPDSKGRRRGPSMPAATSAPGLRSRLPRVHLDWAHPPHMCLCCDEWRRGCDVLRRGIYYRNAPALAGSCISAWP